MVVSVKRLVQRRSNSRFYVGIASVAALTVFVGFAPTFFLRGVLAPVPQSATLTPLLILHGMANTLWIVLFLVQVYLVASRRVALHRRLGVFGAMVAVLLIVVNTMTAVDGLRRGVEPFGLDARTWFLAVPLGDVALFTMLVIPAIVLRRRPETHKRLMLLTTITLMKPALARVVSQHFEVGLPSFLFFTFALTDVFVIAAVAYDLRVRRSVNPAFVWGGTMIIALQPVLLALGRTSAWLALADRVR